MAEASNGFNFMAMLNPQFAAQQQQFALQQAMAQQMMTEGGKEEPTNQLANPGGQVVANSPLLGLSHGIERGLGAYLAKKNIDDQMAAYQKMSGSGTGQQMGSMLGGSAASMYNDPEWQANAAFGGADNATKVWLAKNSPTDLAKNASNPVTQPYMVKDKYLEGGKNYFAPGQNGVQTTASAPMPTSAQPMSPDNVAKMSELYPTEEPQVPPQTNVMPNPIAGVMPGFDPNNSAEVKGAEAAATKAGGGEITDIQKKETGQKQLMSVVNELKSSYDKLDKLGAASNTKNTSFENMAAFAGNSPVGQAVGKVTSTEAQSVRNGIAQQIPALINSIRQATGMSAKNMDSNTELQFYLKMVTDPLNDIQANKRGLDNIINMYGLNNGNSKTIPSMDNIPPLEDLINEGNRRLKVKQ